MDVQRKSAVPNESRQTGHNKTGVDCVITGVRVHRGCRKCVGTRFGNGSLACKYALKGEQGLFRAAEDGEQAGVVF